MKKRHTESNHYKTAIAKIFLFGLLIGSNISLGSCTSQQLMSTPKHLYYVDGNLGSDSNPGSQSLPWQTIQKAAGVLSLGDTVTVIAGTYPERVNISRAGIVFQANGLVNMQGFEIAADNVTVKGFYITNTPGTGVGGHGFYISGSNCIIENNHVFYAVRGGLRFTPATSGCVVRNNKFERNSQYGIEVHGENHLIEGNEVWGTIQYHPDWENPPSYVDADGMHFFGSGHVFRSNYIHDIHYGIPENVDPHIDCFQTFSDTSNHTVASNILFEDNTCINQDAQASDEKGQGFMIGGGAASDGGQSNITIRENLILAYRGINAAHVKNLTITNNTFVGKIPATNGLPEYGVFLVDSTVNMIQNNIFYNIVGGTSCYIVGGTSNGNLFYRSDGGELPCSPVAGDLWGVDPLFVNPDAGDYHLQTGSPAINSGVGGMDFGTYEFSAP